MATPEMSEIGFGSERALRVFVSSTFRDMQAERDELVKRVFPQVRRLCESRGIGWSEVDLRWGVTDEQKAEGAVLPICMSEIDRSRPFFLGLLGQRYGWVPDELPADLAARMPWLRSYEHTSVTELEVLHGVLNDPDARGHAFFHFRDPAWTDAQPEAKRAVLTEADPLGQEKLEQLKDRIRGSAHPWAEYADPVALGDQVLAELTALVDRLFPADETPDATERTTAAHRAYGAARQAGHVARPAVTDVLDAAIEGTGPPVVLHGAAGSDVTPIVAAWAETHRLAHPHEPVLVHHVGATNDAADWKDLAGRIITTLAPAELPSDSAALRAAVFGAFDRAGRSGQRTLVVVDGCELLLDIDGAADLTWLPLDVPTSVRVVLTTADQRTVEEASRRGWHVADVAPLSDADRRAFIASYLGRWSKGLDAVHVDRLATAPQTGSALFLRTVLDELRQHGDHFTLAVVIDHYLGAAADDDLLEQVLARYEGDFERDRPELVGDVFRALAVARHGLSEPELRDLLGDGAPLPQAMWSPLLLAAEIGLVTRGGLISFATPAHRTAVLDRYLPDASSRRAAAGRLARYFAAQPLGPRVVDELPWAQLAAEDLDGLVSTITNLDYLDVAYPLAPEDLRRLWARAEAAGRTVVDAYRPVLADPETHANAAWAVARLVTDAGHPTEALAINRFLVDHYRAGGTPNTDDATKAPARLRASLINLGAALWLQGEFAEANAALAGAVALSRQASDDAQLHAALGNLGLAQRDSGALDAAIASFTEEADLCRRLGDTWGLQASLGNRAGAVRQQGDLTGALGLLAEQETLCRAIGESAGLGAALMGQAAVLADQGDPTAALARFEAYRSWAIDAGDLRAQAEALINEGNTLRQIGRRDEGAARSAEAEALVRRMGDGALLARVLDGQARIASEESRWPDMIRLSDEAVLTARAADARAALVLALSSQGTARRELGDLPGAAAAHQEELAIAQQMGDPAAAATAQVNLGNVAIAGNDLQAGLQWYGLAEPALRERHLAMVLVPLLNNRWQVHSMLGNGPAALADLIDCGHQAVACGAWAQAQQVLTQAIQQLYGSGQQAAAGPVFEDLEVACRHLGDEGALQQAIGDHALLVLGTGDLGRADALLTEQEKICRRTNNQLGLAACVGNRAILKQQQGDLTGALACVDEQLALAQATNNAQGVLFATANRGELLGQLGRPAEAIAALQHARQMAGQWGLGPMVQQLDQMIAAANAPQN